MIQTKKHPIAGPYQEQNPNVKLEFIAVTGIDHEEIASKILSMIAAGQTIDIGYAATEALQAVRGQELLDFIRPVCAA